MFPTVSLHIKEDMNDKSYEEQKPDAFCHSINRSDHHKLSMYIGVKTAPQLLLLSKI